MVAKVWPAGLYQGIYEKAIEIPGEVKERTDAWLNDANLSPRKVALPVAGNKDTKELMLSIIENGDGDSGVFSAVISCPELLDKEVVDAIRGINGRKYITYIGKTECKPERLEIQYSDKFKIKFAHSVFNKYGCDLIASRSEDELTRKLLYVFPHVKAQNHEHMGFYMFKENFVKGIEDGIDKLLEAGIYEGTTAWCDVPLENVIALDFEKLANNLFIFENHKKFGGNPITFISGAGTTALVLKDRAECDSFLDKIFKTMYQVTSDRTSDIPSDKAGPYTAMNCWPARNRIAVTDRY